MKTIEIKLYKFSELSEEAKQNAINELSDINVNCEWWESTYEDAKNIGLKIESFDLDRNRHAKGFFTELAIDVINNILSQHGEKCETFKIAEKYKETISKMSNIATDEEKFDIEGDFLDEILEEYSIILQNESDYLMSDDAIIETIKTNDDDFTENGKLY